MTKRLSVALCLFLIGMFFTACQSLKSDTAPWIYPDVQFVSTDLSTKNAPSEFTILRHDLYQSTADNAQVNAWYKTKGWEHIATWRDRYFVPPWQFKIGGIGLDISIVVSVIFDSRPTQIYIVEYWTFSY